MSTTRTTRFQQLISYILLVGQLVSSCECNKSSIHPRQPEDIQLAAQIPQVVTASHPSSPAVSHGPYQTANGEYEVMLHPEGGAWRASVQPLWYPEIDVVFMPAYIDLRIATRQLPYHRQHLHIHAPYQSSGYVHIGLQGLLGGGNTESGGGGGMDSDRGGYTSSSSSSSDKPVASRPSSSSSSGASRPSARSASSSSGG
jgi:hypothetical protein